jgi:type II secretory pathway pseudopilin PulG
MIFSCIKFQAVIAKLKTSTTNRDGFTFLMAVFIIMIVGILSAFTGKSWTVIMKREREKELIFRGSQIKEAIENWYKPKYTVPGIQPLTIVPPLMDLKDLLQDPNSLTTIHYLPHNYAAELDDKNPKCAPDCAKIKVYQDPMTGKEWTLIRGPNPFSLIRGPNTPAPGPPVGGIIGIIGVASKSDDTPFKTNFKDTALENMGFVVIGPPTNGVGTVQPESAIPPPSSEVTPPPPGLGGNTTKYSDWKFVADPNNDHTKIYRAYHEGW